MTQEAQDKIENFLRRHFMENPGWEGNMPFVMETKNIRLYSVDSIVEGKGITRFQGIVARKNNGFMYQSHSLAEFPIWLFPHVRQYHHTTLYPEINSLCFTVWFKEPMTQELWNTILHQNR